MHVTALLLLLLITCVNSQSCSPSITTVYGKSQLYCSGDLIFSDDFNAVDSSKWFFENTMGGGGNGEFQWYVPNDPLNCYTSNSVLHLAPTTTASVFGESFLSTARVTIPPGQCTWSAGSGCDKQGTVNNIINPIRSTRMDTRNSFSFKYGTMEIRAKMPAGDWLWPALWLMPKKSVYGNWPRSGEIDLTEVRGNLKLMAPWGVNVGVEQTASTLHFGPSPSVNGFMTANYNKNFVPGLNNDFRLYRLRWTSSQIIFYVDNVVYATVDAGELRVLDRTVDV
jgi:beta-glucanase (GH16 family)